MKKTTSTSLTGKLPDNWQDQLKSLGCALSEQGGATVITREGCSATIEIVSGEPRYRVKPGVLFGSDVAHLLDRGFQKFWQTGERRFPARAVELEALSAFDRDLRSVLGMTRLYNEAIGVVSSVYHYDRVEGREPGKRHERF